MTCNQTGAPEPTALRNTAALVDPLLTFPSYFSQGHEI